MSFFPRQTIATAAFALLALPALAQSPAAPASGENSANMPRSGQMQAASKERMQQRMQERRAKHLAQLKEQLQITAAQEPAWNAFTSSMQPGKMPARMDRDEMARLSTPERIDRMRTLRAERIAEADRRGDAIKTFYGALTPAQQKTFDSHSHRMHRGNKGERIRGERGDRKGHHGMHGMGMY